MSGMDPSYAAYLQSDHWKSFREKARAYYGRRCAVCNLDYVRKRKALHVHHYKYWGVDRSSLLGREKMSDVCCLCEDHHPKGSLSKEAVRAYRKNYRFRRRWAAVFRIVGAVFTYLARRLWLLLKQVVVRRRRHKVREELRPDGFEDERVARHE